MLTVANPSDLGQIDDNILRLVYPNPGTNKICFRFVKTGSIRVELFDILGNEVNQVQSEGNNSIEMNISCLPNGIYVYKAWQDGILSRGKIIKK